MQGTYFKPSWSIRNAIIQIKQMLVAKGQVYYRDIAGEGFRFVLHSNCNIMMFIKSITSPLQSLHVLLVQMPKVHIP